MQSPLMRPRDAAEYLGVAENTLHKMVKDGRMPAPVQLSDRRYAYRLSDLDALVRATASTVIAKESR